MKNPFTLFDIKNLMKSFGNATVANDCLTPFLDSYDFEDVYETEDNSLVFEAGGQNRLSVEFFNFEHPLEREVNIMYWENGKPVILMHDDLIKIA